MEEKFWSNPDSWLSVIILNDNGDQVYGRVKNNLALIERLPNSNTGFHFNDVVKVNKTNNQQLYKDDNISVYKAEELYFSSGNLTYQFKAIISNTSEYFDLQRWFTQHNQISSLVFKTKYEKDEWNTCFCSAKNLTQANNMLSDFQAKVVGKWYENIIGKRKSNFQYKELQLCE